MQPRIGNGNHALAFIRVNSRVYPAPELRTCTAHGLGGYGADPGGGARKFRTVVVNLAQVIGVAEAEGTGNQMSG